MKNIFSSGLFLSCAIVISLLFAEGCKKANQVGPGDLYCQSGRNILTLSGISQSVVPDSIKNMIYGTGGANSLGNWYNDLAKRTNRKLVIIPVTYTGVSANSLVTQSFIRTAIFGNGNGSVKDYFYDNSWGTYNLQEGEINSTWVNLPQSTTQYGTGQPGTDFTRNPQLPSDACRLSSVNWAAIDANGDRIITRDEAVVCLLSPLGGAGATRYLTFTFYVGNYQYTVNSDNPVCYFDCKTAATQTGTDDISYNYSSIWHELCHAQFDFPDRYFGYCGQGSTGPYDLMSNNCVKLHMNIVDKIKLGWLAPPVLVSPNTSTCYNFPASENNPAALILWNPAVPHQYFVIENRYRAASARGFDDGLPESGLAIWWVNEDNADIRLRMSMVDARTVPLRMTNDPTAAITPLYYTGGESSILFKNVSCRSDADCPIIFLKYGAGASSSTLFLHGIQAVSAPQQNMYAAFF